MKASELRIGNQIYVKCIAKECGHDEFDAQECNIHNLKGILEGNDDFLYEPIPITEEWLLNLGLTGLKRKNEKHFKFNDFVYVLDYGCVTYNGVIISRQDIKYVHQLQNLYFALTGEELTLKKSL